MTTRASQWPSSSAHTSSLAWFCRSGGGFDALRAGFLAENAPFTPWGQYSPVSVSLKDISASSRRGCTNLWKSCKALPLPLRGFSSTSTLHGRGSNPLGQPAIQNKPGEAAERTQELEALAEDPGSVPAPGWWVIHNGPKLQSQGILRSFLTFKGTKHTYGRTHIHTCTHAIKTLIHIKNKTFKQK